MNDTRKELINILSDYMEKELSEWCLLYINECWVDKESKKYIATILDIKEVVEEEEWECLVLYMKQDEITVSKDIINVFNWEKHLRNSKDYTIKILWHYDISAVWKFIRNSKWAVSVKIVKGNIDFLEITVFWDKTYIIPNKPLHLYTEQEEKNLLKLLLKLKEDG